MSRWEFMRQLEELLSDISPSEREEALQYYNDYFNDAGRENEKEVVESLGSPEQVARTVKEGLSDGGSFGEFTESGFKDAASSQQNPIIKRGDGAWGQEEDDAASDGQAKDPGSGENGSAGGFGGSGSSGEPGWNNGQGENKGSGWGGDPGWASGTEDWSERAYQDGREDGQPYTTADRGWKGKDRLPGWAIVLIVIGCLFALPAIFGVIGGVGGAILGIIGGAVGIVAGAGAATAALYAVAICLFIAGFGSLFTQPAVGIGLLGGGCICGALGILFMLLTVFLVGKCIPAICRGIAYLCRKLFGKKGGNAV